MVVDSGEIASGASSVNGGMVSPDIKAGIKFIFDQHGPELGREMWQATVRSVDIVSDLTATESIDANIMRGGMAALRDRPRRAGQVRTERLLVSRACRGRLGGARPGSDRRGDRGRAFHHRHLRAGGLRNTAGRVRFRYRFPGRRSRGPARAHCEAASFEKDGPGFRVVTSKGPIRAGDRPRHERLHHRPTFARARPTLVPSGPTLSSPSRIADRAGDIFPGGAMTYTKKRLSITCGAPRTAAS